MQESNEAKIIKIIDELIEENVKIKDVLKAETITLDDIENISLIYKKRENIINKLKKLEKNSKKDKILNNSENFLQKLKFLQEDDDNILKELKSRMDKIASDLRALLKNKESVMKYTIEERLWI